MKLFITVWMFLTSIFLVALGLEYAVISKFDIWPFVILWGAVCFVIGVIKLINEQYPNWWKK